jgi:hypothetical protein
MIYMYDVSKIETYLEANGFKVKPLTANTLQPKGKTPFDPNRVDTQPVVEIDVISSKIAAEHGIDTSFSDMLDDVHQIFTDKRAHIIQVQFVPNAKFSTFYDSLHTLLAGYLPEEYAGVFSGLSYVNGGRIGEDNSTVKWADNWLTLRYSQ